ncbi:MAG: WYL domain-containing protein [Candidatus Gastranaerophilales bacterium]|nr:WYL domain-containing protein [Candidatus Gastranaerophilales bacterium]
MSKDSFLIYISTLRHIGFEIGKESETFTYYLKNNIDMLFLNKNDIKILSEIKKLFLQANNYKDVINYNNFLFKLSKYTDDFAKNKIMNIVEQSSIKLSEHEKILFLEDCVNNKTPLLILHNSNSIKKTFKILPISLKLENAKLYLWGKDNDIEEPRCLTVDKISEVKIIDEKFECYKDKSFGICEFKNQIYLKLFDESNFEILNKHNNKDIVKVYFSNQFEFFQKILTLGTDCKIIENEELKEKFKQLILNIGKKYE